MKKIGLYLGSEPSGGGAFQYGLAMLEAVASLRGEDYDVLVAYSSTSWASILKGYDIAILHIPLRAYEMNIALWWRRLGLPTNLWRKIARKFHTFTKCFIQSNCDLWIFPSQDIWAYRVPVPTLCAIHDLMHRYERRFAEVSAYGRYKRREAHYKDICKWSKGILVDSNIGKQQVEGPFIRVFLRLKNVLRKSVFLTKMFPHIRNGIPLSLLLNTMSLSLLINHS